MDKSRNRWSGKDGRCENYFDVVEFCVTFFLWLVAGIALSILLETRDVSVWITDVNEKVKIKDSCFIFLLFVCLQVLAACIDYCEKELSRKGFDGKATVGRRLATTSKLDDLKGKQKK